MGSLAFGKSSYSSKPSRAMLQVISAAKLLNQLPQLPLHAVIQRIFPFQVGEMGPAWGMGS